MLRDAQVHAVDRLVVARELLGMKAFTCLNSRMQIGYRCEVTVTDALRGGGAHAETSACPERREQRVL